MSAGLQSLIRDFFKVHGARVKRRKPGLHVDLSDSSPEEPSAELASLRERFGQERLELVFSQDDLAGHAELVVEGGHVLRVIEEFVGERGARAYVEQPATARLTKAALRERLVLAEGVSLGALERETLPAWDLYLVFKLELRSRTRRDELLSARVRIVGDAVVAIDDAAPPKGIAEWDWKPRKTPPKELLVEAHRRACQAIEARSVEIALGFREDGKAAIHKDILRIKAFYSGQIKELMGNRTPSDKARTRILELEEEQARKIRELLEAIQVHVDVETAQMMIVERPLQRASLTLTRGGEREAVASLDFDRSGGEVTLPAALEASAEAPVDICSGGHITRSPALRGCRCERLVCEQCGSPDCYLCGQATCERCQGGCERCGEVACPEHLGRCPRCEEARCADCSLRCVSCEAALCKSCHKGLEGEPPLCPDCGAACASCGGLRALAALRRCEVCGRRFCEACLPGEGSCASCA